MLYIERYGSKLFLTIIEIVSILFAITILYYFDFIGEKTYALLKIIVLLGVIFFNAFLLGKTSSQKGYWEGIKYGTLFIVIFALGTLIFSKLQIKHLLYYFLILSSSTLGSMIGISQKRQKKTP